MPDRPELVARGPSCRCAACGKHSPPQEEPEVPAPPSDMPYDDDSSLYTNSLRGDLIRFVTGKPENIQKLELRKKSLEDQLQQLDEVISNPSIPDSLKQQYILARKQVVEKLTDTNKRLGIANSKTNN